MRFAGLSLVLSMPVLGAVGFNITRRDNVSLVSFPLYKLSRCPHHCGRRLLHFICLPTYPLRTTILREICDSFCEYARTDSHPF